MINNIIGKYLISNNILNEKQIEEVLTRCNIVNERIEKEIVKMKLLNEEQMQKHLSLFWNLEFITINVASFNLELSNLLPLAYIKDYKILPIKNNIDSIEVAIVNPYMFNEVNNLKNIFNKNIKLFLITESNFNNLIISIENRSRRKEAIGEIKVDKETEIILEDNLVSNSPSVVLADSYLKEAVAQGASDIHIEPFDNEVIIRYRLDGYLLFVNKIQKNAYDSLLARFKILASLNIAERRIPQDGKIRLEIEDKSYDFRISTLPTIHGEKIVVRIYDVNNNVNDLTSLGLSDLQFKDLKEIISKPHGIFLVTGPTGSGKSTTLYTVLRSLNKGDINITTVEDPVENQIKGINQVQVNTKANLTFSSALRSILRQDPNIIMIGEIRDEETAQMTIRAAITGHLVLSTLHTNDAIGSITRLVDMGIPRYLVADALTGVAAQRLVRKLCNNCKKSHTTTEDEMKKLGIDKPVKINHKVGCEVCNNTGYSGRIGVFEIIKINSGIKSLIENEDLNAEELRKYVQKNGVSFLKDNCKTLVIDGITSIQEYETLINFEE